MESLRFMFENSNIGQIIMGNTITKEDEKKNTMKCIWYKMAKPPNI